MGRLTGTTTNYAFLTSRSFTNSYQYDAGSNRTGFTDPESGATSYAYDALNVSNRFRGNIDLMVTDVVMPGMSGPELAQHLLEQRPATRVLYVSGYTGSVLAEQLTLGASAAFLEKPFAWDAFARKVREVLEHAEAPPAQEMVLSAMVH